MKNNEKSRSLKFVFFISTTLLAILCAMCMLPGDTIAFRPAVNAIRKAVSKNINQALKPSFNVASRYSKAMLSITFSKNGQYFATLSANGSAQIWDAQTGQKIRNMHSREGTISATAFSKTSEYIATGTSQGELALWDIHQGKITHLISASSGAISALIEIPGHGWLIASNGGLVKLVDIKSAGISRLFHVNGAGDALCLTLNHKGDKVISGHRDGKIRIWDMLSGQLLLTIDGKGGAVHAMDTSSDDVLAAALKSGEVKLWNLVTGRKILFEQPHDVPARAVAISHDSTYIASGGDDGIVYISLLGGKSVMSLKGHEGPIHSICFHPDDNFLFTAGTDKTARCWDWHEEKKEAARMIVMRDGWAVVSPEGFFDGTLDGDVEDRLESIQWMVGTDAFSVDGFMEHYYEPGLLGKILQGQAVIRDKFVADISQGFPLPPEITLSISTLLDKPAASSRAEYSQVVVEAVDQGGGIDEIRLYHNDKALGDSTVLSSIRKAGKLPGKIKTYEVRLVEGMNRFRAVGFSDNRIESEPVEKEMVCRTPEQAIETTLHVVSIGINKYKNPVLDLNFAVPDAKGLLEGISEAHADVFDVFTYYELYDQDATLENINQLFLSLRALPPQDTVIVYISGHGELYKNNWYYVPYDLFQPNDHSQLMKKGMSSTTLVSVMTNIGARQVLLLLDCCKSGAVADAFKDQKVLALLSRLAGIHIGAAATKEQDAGELKTLGHGLFTFALLEGIRGEADRRPADGKISVKEMLTYVKTEMPELIRRHETPHQKPVVNLRGMDFLIADAE